MPGIEQPNGNMLDVERTAEAIIDNLMKRRMLAEEALRSYIIYNIMYIRSE